MRHFRLHAGIAVAAAIALTVEYWAFGPYSAMYGYGASLETVPTWLGLIKTGSLHALWQPFVGGGSDRLSFWGNADPFHPEALLFTVLPTWAANGSYLFLQRFVPMLAIMRVAQEQLGFGRSRSVLTGLLYGGLTYPAAGYMMAEASVPLVIWLLPHLARQRWSAFWAVAGGTGLATLTTFVWSEPFEPLFVLAWFFVVVDDRRLGLYRTILILFAVQAMLNAPQMLALLANAPASHRAGWPVETVDWSWSGLFYFQTQYDLFNQDRLLKGLTIALPPIAAAVGIALAGFGRLRGEAVRLFWRVLFLYALVSLKMAIVGSQAVLSHWLPWVRGVNMSRFYDIPAPFLIPLLIMLCLGMGGLLLSRFDRMIVRAGQPAAALALATLLLFLLIRPKIFLFDALLIDGWGEGNYRVAALDRLRSPDGQPFRVASVLPLQPAYAYGQGLETADGWSNLYPALYRDLWLRVIAPGMAQLPAMKQIIDPEGGRPQDHYIFLNLDLVTPGIGRLPGEDPATALRDGFALGRRVHLALLSALNVRYVLSLYPLSGDGLTLVHQPAIRPTEVRSRDYATGLDNSPRASRTGSWLHQLQQAMSDLRQAIASKRHGKDLFVYENAHALSRFRLVDRLVLLPSDRDVLDRLSAMDVTSLGQEAVTTSHAAPDVPTTFGRGEVRVDCYSPDAIDLAIRHDGPAFLVIANSWNARWRAEIDGRDRPLLRVNEAQFGLALRPGETNVSLRYRPSYRWLPFLDGAARAVCES